MKYVMNVQLNCGSAIYCICSLPQSKSFLICSVNELLGVKSRQQCLGKEYVSRSGFVGIVTLGLLKKKKINKVLLKESCCFFVVTLAKSIINAEGCVCSSLPTNCSGVERSGRTVSCLDLDCGGGRTPRHPRLQI